MSISATPSLFHLSIHLFSFLLFFISVLLFSHLSREWLLPRRIDPIISPSMKRDLSENLPCAKFKHHRDNADIFSSILEKMEEDKQQQKEKERMHEIF